MNTALLLDESTHDEGLRLVVYDDATGKPLRPGDRLVGNATIGIGRNLCRGISKAEALYLWENDVADVTQSLDRVLPWWRNVNGVRQRVLVHMCFNLGASGLLGFKHFLIATHEGDWETAAREMLSSLWATEVGSRAQRLAEMMRLGVVPESPT